MNFCLDATALRAALADIEAAEANGFMHCLAVMQLSATGPMLSDVRATYSDMIERAHPTDGRFNWGRCQGVSKRFRFDGTWLVPLDASKQEKPHDQG